MEVIKPPSYDYTRNYNTPAIFLAGSIEMGTASKWQDKVQEELKDLKCLVFNPRRDDWDSSWEQKKSNKKFRGQVLWELHHLKETDIALFYFDGATKSPITLLELGLVAGHGIPSFVFCPKEFWRKGNVDIVCDEFGLRIFDKYEQWIKTAKRAINDFESGPF